MENIKIKSLGPITEADINFGDLTFFVGPQASGKSILLQTIKLVSDTSLIETRLKNRGYIWESNTSDNNLERFFGEGMSHIWSEKTLIEVDSIPFDKRIDLTFHIKHQEQEDETVFYIPTQRVLCFNNGWPRSFTDFDDSVPYVLRDFSEVIRLYLDIYYSHDESPVFPLIKNIRKQLTSSVNESIFYGGEVTVEKRVKKRLKLHINGLNLPFMTWSTGQKEYMPLLIGFYWLCGSTTGRRLSVETVIIEEPEMGIHPEAIKSVLLQIIELLARGYKVIISTHSPVLLEFAWAFNILKQENASPENFDNLFDLNKDPINPTYFTKELINKTINTYYFNRAGGKVIVKDISTLDAGNDDPAIAEWGGLSSFASKATDIVSTIVANNG